MAKTTTISLFLLFQAASLLHGADAQAAYTTNEVNGRAGPCPDDADQIGYRTITAVNLDQRDEADKVQQGDSPRTPYVFPFCNTYKYMVDQGALEVVLDNAIFLCGYNGNKEELCVFEGAGPQVRVPENITATFQGITFADFTNSSTQAGPNSHVVLHDVAWSGFKYPSELVAHDSPMEIEISQAIIRNGAGSNLLTNHGGQLTATNLTVTDGVEADVLITSVGDGTTSISGLFVTDSTIKDMYHVSSESSLSVNGVSIGDTEITGGGGSDASGGVGQLQQQQQTSLLIGYLASLPVTPAGVLDNPNSPQARAASWVAQDPISAGLHVTDQKVLQRYVLATFYYSTSGDEWEQCGANSSTCNDTPWLSDENECSWYGLGCNREGGLFQIRFPPNGNNLIGPLPVELSLLTSVRRIFASENALSGDLDVLSAMSELEILYLPLNRFRGSIPDSIYSLAELQSLSLAKNALSGTISPRLGQLTSLTDLELGHSSINGPIPTDLFKLPALAELNLENARISGTIPESIGQLNTTLTYLILNDNQLTGPLPAAFDQLTSLETLQIQGNQLTGSISSAVCALQLTTLVVGSDITCDCCGNSSSAAVVATPDQVVISETEEDTPLASLSSGLSGRNATSQTMRTTALSSDLVAYLEAMSVSSPGVFDDATSPQSQAASWIANEDDFSASLPVTDPKLLQRYALATFYFSTGGDSWQVCGQNSQSCGDIVWLSDADECTWFGLDCNIQGFLSEIRFPSGGNFLVGSLPAEMSLLGSLKSIVAPSNALSGDLAVLGGLGWLEILYLPLNRFRGSIPDALYSLTGLKTLSLAQNILTGTVSSLIGQLTDLTILQLGSSQLGGGIPVELYSLPALSELNLQGAFFTGSITFQIAGLYATLTDLLLNDNRLTGPVPAAFNRLTSLERLQIQGNQMTGRISGAVCDMQLSTLIVGSDIACDCCDNGATPVTGATADQVVLSGVGQGIGGFSSSASNLTGVGQLAVDKSTLVAYLETLRVTAPGVFDDPNSPQSLAATWITEEDLYSANMLVNDPKLLQRYALATFYYSTSGDNWEACGRESTSCGDTPWLTDVDECTWFSLACTNKGGLTEIKFPTNGNRLIGPIPAEMSLLTGLQSFVALEGALNGGLDHLAGLPLLETLDLELNRFRGTIPDSIYFLPSLKTLSLERNAWTGSISTLIGRLSNLEVLELGSSQMTGTIPIEMFQLSKLSDLNLRDAFFAGTIPELIGLLHESLKVLVLNNNRFTGSVPASFDLLTGLQKLEIQGNRLTGSISATTCAQRGTFNQGLSTLIVDCDVECSCCDDNGCLS